MRVRLLLEICWGRKCGVENHVGARTDVSPLGWLGLGQSEREHRDGEHNVGGLDPRRDESPRLFAPAKLISHRGDPIRKQYGVGIVPMGCQEVNQRGGCDGLLGDRVEQIVESCVFSRSDRFQVDDVVIEDGDSESYSIGEVTVEASLPDTGPTTGER
jgi:hypothetical protein